MTVGLILALALAALIGVSLGLLGSGGSIVTLPVLVYAAGVPVKSAIGMSLAIVGGTSAAGAFLHARQGGFAIRVAAMFAVSGMVGAYFGAKLTHLVSARLLLILFGALMVVVGTALLRKRQADGAASSCHWRRCLAAGAVVGLLTGFLGVGGGFLIVPALVLFAGLGMKKAIGTSLAVIAANSFAGLLGQLRYTSFDWRLALGFLALALVGMWLGTRIARHLSAPALQRGFAWCIIAVGVFLLVENLAGFQVVPRAGQSAADANQSGTFTQALHLPSRRLTRALQA